MNGKVINAKVSYWLKAKDITSDVWRMIKLEHPSKYRKMKADLATADINNVKYGFAEGLRPREVLISY